MGDSLSWGADDDAERREKERRLAIKYRNFLTVEDRQRFMEDHKVEWTSKYYSRFSPGELYIAFNGADYLYGFNDVNCFVADELLDKGTGIWPKERIILPGLSPVIYLEPYFEWNISPKHRKLAKVLWEEKILLVAVSQIKSAPAWLKTGVSYPIPQTK